MEPDTDAALTRLLAERRERLLREVPSAVDSPALDRLVLASDFAYEALLADPAAWDAMQGGAISVPELAPGDEAGWPGQLRRFRRLTSLRLLWRDLSGEDTIEQTLAGASLLAEQCLQAGLAACEGAMAESHGCIHAEDGTPQRMVVFALGKLGGGELNFSSDVDLVFAYPRRGTSDGARPLDADGWFTRLGQRLIRLLDDVTPDGFCHRVDMRLRPFGASGRLALPFAAMEQYFQREGRDWERYAWIKARPVAGDIAAGEEFLDSLRPFIYRRYLDYNALDSLREMKAMIAAEVARRDLAEHIKLGPGGIREIEFLAQALQLIRGGREAPLRTRGLLSALAALAAAGHLEADVAEALAQAYRFLRRLENRLQMMGDRQEHALPDDALMRARIARGLGFADFAAMHGELARHRETVSGEFERLLAPRRRSAQVSDLALYWRHTIEADPATRSDPSALADAGFEAFEEADQALREFAASPALRALSARGRQRLDNVLPALLHAAGSSRQPDVALPRLLAMLQAIVRRTSYLALLDEQPGARQRLVDVTARSALLAERLAEHPLLLDELLDTRASGAVPTREGLEEELGQLLVPVDVDDTEEALRILNEFRQSVAFRIGFATLAGRQPAGLAARQLAWLAEVVVLAALPLAEAALVKQHGRIPAAGIAIVGYGSFGGEELGFSSDLDLVFLYSCAPDALSDGQRPIEAARWYGRLVQKLLGLLDTITPAGRLYEVDLRLRPDGAGGLLVTSLESFAGYQRQRAWTWEQQALVRARAIGGRGPVEEIFEAVRAETLQMPRESERLREDVVRMRRRMRGELDRSRPGSFDLKQGSGGLVDLEFLLQYLVLAHANAHPELAGPRRSDDLVEALVSAGVLSKKEGDALVEAHSLLLSKGLECTLDHRPRLVPAEPEMESACGVVAGVCRAHGLDFEAADASNAVAESPR
ncbi:bifunctional [glutamate--ammonia ligase]-adenylyl-L-tyrosine phosphorylase/[glutamate--ammonia-ligase] adenylyltransferase [Alkalisalibacterium limincola]|uniref:Bifunctional glutamine synthetase adenylyltransferase/adenylyl-removing enzyme n=1 Tax=Alkalisalibacterium limincola TaxID=2699169 RepID=A0A5C8KJX5_9GAMM|nr:bifunctional [glutamate--ammonia ligase]-adenylyl-L-tyrosine phosphorylase/[glutamate--ammonia-ligase] adenylyltransferase [Alkalisalibacterium limincola]TXK61068.1 bifunctional [glutamate--ammonia ligase]-adenylyl-L-tyrosine phosphorylase/[glutamate--ammonia-ligase] adenylyltransferase [Alkalisalibacterium limincola]